MQETALQDLDPRLQQQIENARKAVSKNPVYAIDILMNILERHNGCLEARKILRQAQKRLNKGNSGGLSKLFSKFSMGGSKPAKDPVSGKYVVVLADCLSEAFPLGQSQYTRNTRARTEPVH